MAAGEAAAMDDLYGRFRSGMLALALRISRDRTVADDAVQDALMQAWRDAARYDPTRGSVAAWLGVITRGRTLDRLRSQQLRTARVVAEIDPDTTRSHHVSPHDHCETHERLALVSAVLEVLPRPDRSTVELALEGFTHTEIAARLGLPLGTAKTQLRRGLDALRAAASVRPRRPFRWQARRAASDSSLDHAHILVVDDEADTRKLTALVLRRAGAVVITAESAAQACDRVSSLWPDLALIDLEMPERDGYDLLRALRQREVEGFDLPAIAFTANSSAVERRRTAAAGFELHLAKPIAPGLLVRNVARVLADSPFRTADLTAG